MPAGWTLVVLWDERRAELYAMPSWERDVDHQGFEWWVTLLR